MQRLNFIQRRKKKKKKKKKKKRRYIYIISVVTWSGGQYHVDLMSWYNVSSDHTRYQLIQETWPDQVTIVMMFLLHSRTSMARTSLGP